MADLSVTHTFTNGEQSDAANWNTDYSDIVTYINNRNSGSSTWDFVHVSTASGVPFLANNSTGSSAIAQFQANGSNVFSIGSTGTVTFTQPLQGGTGSTGSPTYSFSGDSDTGMENPSANEIGFAFGGTENVRMNGSLLKLIAGQIEAPDGLVGTPSFAFASAATNGFYYLGSNRIGVACNGGLSARFTTASFDAGSDNGLSCGTSGNRWTAVWAVNGTIQTSHSSTKTDIRPLSDFVVPSAISFRRPEDKTNKTHLGFLADDLQKEAFVDDINVETQAVIGNLCAGWHSHQDRLSSLEKRLAALEAN